jgi:hypothetical protein
VPDSAEPDSGTEVTAKWTITRERRAAARTVRGFLAQALPLRSPVGAPFVSRVSGADWVEPGLAAWSREVLRLTSARVAREV